jgi:hypothetical protein
MVFLNWHSNGPSSPLHSIPNVRKVAFCHVIIASLVILNSHLYVNVSAETENETASTNTNTQGFSKTTLKNTTDWKTHDPHANLNSTKQSSEIGVWFYANKVKSNIRFERPFELRKSPPSINRNETPAVSTTFTVSGFGRFFCSRL